ncbi:MAG: hypothetical protein PHI13_12870 [Methylococcales bacterium]|nr:hypothetical protein [Methylococcales bacterium]
MASILYTGERLRVGEKLISDSGRYHLILQPDGNLVIYNEPEHEPRWKTDPRGNDVSYVEIQTDGNLVMYTDDRQARWASDSVGSIGNYILGMQSDGNLVIYLESPTGRSPWATHTEEPEEPTPGPESEYCCTVYDRHDEAVFNGTIQASSLTSAFMKCNQIREDNFGTAHSISEGSC